MNDHTFGGNWTEEKLARLDKYLTTYRTIFANNEKAKHFRTWYVDAFAGTGSRSEPTASHAPGMFDDVYQETNAFRDGSARIALQLGEPFHNYLFIEKSKARVSELQQVVATDFAPRLARCSFQHGDANALLRQWCMERDWKKDRAVVFLDPYGMQVEWSTIEALGATRGVDLWYLFPLGVGVSRMLPRDGNLTEAWSNRLDLIFGTHDWYDRFYRRSPTLGLFDDIETLERDVPEQKINDFIHERLGSAFFKVAKGLVLRNSKSSPLYLLCFAASNERGAPIAIRIAQSILGS